MDGFNVVAVDDMVRASYQNKGPKLVPAPAVVLNAIFDPVDEFAKIQDLDELDRNPARSG